MSFARTAAGVLYDRLPFKKPLLSLLKPLGLPERIYRHLHFQGIIEVTTSGRSFRLRHEGRDIENELFWEGLPGNRERVSMQLWMQLCPTATTIVDVGANSGVYALTARTINQVARVLAFEPLPDVHARLVRNIELNAFDIDAPRVALSDEPGVAHMQRWSIRQDGSGTIEVPVARLDDLLDERGIDRVDLLKIDVEGHEPHVLRGFERRLSAHRPTLLIEVLTDTAAERLAPFFEPLEYLFFDLDEVGSPRILERIRKSTRWNLLACRPDVARALGLL